MTNFERTKQPLSVFEHAGRLAFRMQVLKTSNPYPKTDQFGVAEPANLAWDRGYQEEADAASVKERAARPTTRKPVMPRKPVKPRTERPANHPRFVGNRGTAPKPEVRSGK